MCIHPAIAALEHPTEFVRNPLGHLLPIRREVKATTGPHGDAARVSPSILPLGDDRPYQVPGLKPEMLLLAGEMADREPLFVGPAPLPVPLAMGGPHLHIGGKAGQTLWGTSCNRARFS